jgi:hypothetical protein
MVSGRGKGRDQSGRGMASVLRNTEWITGVHLPDEVSLTSPGTNWNLSRQAMLEG